MSQPSNAYLLADNLFGAFQGLTGLFSEEQVEESGILRRLGHMTNIPGIEGRYDLGGRRARQRLSLGKNGLYFFTTTYIEPGGEVIHNRVSPNSDNHLAELQESVFKLAFDAVITEMNNGARLP